MGKKPRLRVKAPGLWPGKVSCLCPGLSLHFCTPRNLRWVMSEGSCILKTMIWKLQSGHGPRRWEKGKNQRLSRGRAGARVSGSRLSASPPHQSCSINVSGLAWAEARGPLRRGRNCLWLKEQRGKNAELPKSREQVVSPGWEPRGFATVLPA